ncbi:MAG: Rrf2 family transcriptional regulator [Clostridiales bacterium]|nr:Rrf2 family transcriptional regulator [Clostridiales bacterium]
MKFSTRANYGLRLCFLIGIAEETISLSTLVKQTKLSQKYLEQLLSMLKKGGVVESTRGASGGYVLAHPAEEITIKDILVAVDDHIEVECIGGECSDEYCPNRRIFTRLFGEMDKLLASLTLKDMIDDYKCY